MPRSEGVNPSILLTLILYAPKAQTWRKRLYMNKVEKYLMKEIEAKDREIKSLHKVIDHMDDYRIAFFKEQRFLDIVSKKAEIKSFESSDGTIKRYIDLGDVNDYGSDQPDFNFVADLLGLKDPEDIEHNFEKACECECCSECEDCEEGDEEDE